MAHPVQRSFDQDAADLLGVSRLSSAGDRFDLEVAKLLLARKQLSLTGLAAAMHARAQDGSTLAQSILSAGPVAPVSYYRAVADTYGLPFVDIAVAPIDPALVPSEERAEYVRRGMVPWRMRDGRMLIATSAITSDQVEWADAHLGEHGYDFVITSPAAWQAALRSLLPDA